MIFVNFDFMKTFPVSRQGRGSEIGDSSKVDHSKVGVLCFIEAVDRYVLGTTLGKLNIKISQPFGMPFQAFEKQKLRSTYPSHQSQTVEQGECQLRRIRACMGCTQENYSLSCFPNLTCFS